MYEKLRDYQKEDVQKYIQHNCIGNFSEQRTGKTPTTCVSLSVRGITRALIVCPASLAPVWKDEYEKWTGNKAMIVPNTKWDVSEWDADTTLVINYEKLRGTSKQQDLAKALAKAKPKAIIVDEAHRMKDRGSLTAQVLRMFIPKVPIRIALTGTPNTNKQWDVWTILHWLYPVEYKSFWKFIDEYFNQQSLYINGNLIKEPTIFKPGMDKLLQMNLDIKCIQHKRSEVMPWLKEQDVPTIVRLDCTKTQTKAIEQLTKYFEYKHIITKNVLENLIRIRQICAAPAILGIRGASPKLNWLIDYITDYPEESILVFSNSKKFINYMLPYLKKELEEVAVITGDTDPRMRSAYVNRFQTNTIRVLLIQTQAGKEGLTLDNADVTIFLDTYPPAADYLQAKDRMVATTEAKNKPKKIIHVMMKDTYDESLYALVESNASSIAVINDYKKYLENRRN